MRYFKLKNFFIILLSIVVFSSVTSAIVVHADDDEDEVDNEESQSVAQPAPQTVSQPAATKTTKPKTVKKTIVDPPTTVVVNELKNIELLDSDRDGLIDNEDPHPNTPEIYFVKDDNHDGIVDAFENYVQQ